MHSVSKIILTFLVPLYGIGTQFMVLPSSADELSIGSHSTLPGLFPINPALFIASENHPNLSINRGVWLGDVVLAQIGYNQAMEKKIIHVGLKYSGLSDLEFRDDIPRDNALAEFSSFGLALDAGVSITRETHKFGLSLSYIHMGLYTEQSKGMGLNLGYVRTFKRGLTMGLALQNLGKMTKLSAESPALPRRFTTGISKQLQFNEYKNTVYGSLEWNPVTSMSKYYFGNQFRWDRLSILAGFSASDSVIESSLGFGLHLNRYQVTYGIKVGSQNLGLPQIVSLKLTLP
jgi:hypothetical protein